MRSILEEQRKQSEQSKLQNEPSQQMRTEQQMYDLIVGIAQNDDRILAVYMNGSRTNKHVPKDIFQDYDVVYVVRETDSFLRDRDWINVFGEQLIMQEPYKLDQIAGKETHFDQCYGYLMQLKDGNRVDLHIQTLEYTIKEFQKDKLTVILWDENHILPQISPASDEDYWVIRPTQELFFRCCNEFWWVLNNVAKGLWRNEIPYVMDNLNLWIRPQLVKLLSWHVGIDTDFSCSVGKSGKYLYKYLPAEIWNQFLQTYPRADVEEIWESVFVMCHLFDSIANGVGGKLNLNYDQVEANYSLEYLHHVHKLPLDAKAIY